LQPHNCNFAILKTDKMENKPSRRPRPRLKVPFLGDLGGIGGNVSGEPVNTDPNAINKLLSRLTPLIVLVFGAWMLFNTGKSFSRSDGIDSADDIKEVAWENLKVTKKYPSQSKHLMIELKGKNYKETYDLTNEKSQLWDYIMPYDYLTKAPNSLEVKVKNYSGKDTTLVMKFGE
jgi:hypothetical protein